MGRTLTVLGLLAGLLWISPAAIARDFPQDAKRGTLNAHHYPQYRIGSTTYRLSTGGRIYNEKNLVIMPASLQRARAEIMYRLGVNGELSTIWLLTPEEARLIPKPGTIRTQ
jgi:hypothetical protein